MIRRAPLNEAMIRRDRIVRIREERATCHISFLCIALCCWCNSVISCAREL
jgi:hypothetical protein